MIKKSQEDELDMNNSEFERLEALLNQKDSELDKKEE